MELFRGYVPTRNKQCLEKFKGVEKLKTRSEVQDLDEYAGILGEETILIDVDDAETSELLFRIVQDLELKCRVYATTRGKHFLFKNCGVKKSWTKCTLAVGITTDGKVGANNSKQIVENDRAFDMDKESSILWMLHTQFGFGPKRLKLAWKLFYAETLKLREHYLMEQADDGWLARKKLKDIGCDIEEWYREEGGKTDA